MQAPWHEGDISSGNCYACRKQVATRFERRSIRPDRSAVTYPNVLVSVCTECNATVELPRQSVAQFLELASWK
jgi:hypothetical protein